MYICTVLNSSQGEAITTTNRIKILNIVEMFGFYAGSLSSVLVDNKIYKNDGVKRDILYLKDAVLI